MAVHIFYLSDIDQSAPANDWARACRWPILGRETIEGMGTTQPSPNHTKFALVQPDITNEGYEFEVLANETMEADPQAFWPTATGTIIINYGPGWRLAISEVQ